LTTSMKQSEIWLIDLDPTKGAEIQKIRPAIIVNNDRPSRHRSGDHAPEYNIQTRARWNC